VLIIRDQGHPATTERGRARGDWRPSKELADRQERSVPALPAVPELPRLDPPEQEPAEPVLLHALDDE
jgi:hypothetical protein